MTVASLKILAAAAFVALVALAGVKAVPAQSATAIASGPTVGASIDWP